LTATNGDDTGTVRTHRCSATWRRFDLKAAAEGVEPVPHVRQTGASPRGAHIEPTSIVGDLNTNMSAVFAQAHHDG
jgi:hypothetical protein